MISLLIDPKNLLTMGHSHNDYFCQVSWKSLHWLQRYRRTRKRC